jgi:HK97 family phage portal protein
MRAALTNMLSLRRAPRQTRDAGDSELDLNNGILRRTRTDTGAVEVNQDTALRQSAVWACVRLRADHMSTLPVDVFRDLDGIAVEVPKKPQIFITPGGDAWPWHDWAWASQSDLDRTGNAVGLIVERDPLGIPRTIALQNTRTVSVRVSQQGDVTWMIGGKTYRPDQVWHERQFPVSGMILGLSPIAYAAWTIGEAMSMQQFAMKWFGQGGVPRARLRNAERVVPPKEAIAIKDRWRSSVEGGDLFVTGKDWEYDLIQAENAGMEWLEGRKASVPEIARYFGCPSDMIDGAASGGGGQINYANITQRNLQFLIHHLGPTVIRREHNWSRLLLPAPRYVKLNTDALLRMDPETREKTIRSQLESKQITVTEARALNNRKPYTPAEEAEVEKFFPAKKAAPAGAGGNPQDDGTADEPVPTGAKGKP